MAGAVPAPAPNGRWHITIGIPSHAMCPIEFAFDLANLVGYSKGVLGEMFDFSVMHIGGTYIHKARQELMASMLEAGCHYMLWLDSDMRFPKDSLVKLLARDLPMVGINYSTRGIPPRFVAIKKMTHFNDDGELQPGKVCETNEDSTGVEKVDAVGFGMVLIKAVVTQGMPADEPWFFYEWREETGKLHVGEDVWFCKLVRANGYDVHVDHDLSKECAHIGVMEYKLDHVWGIREALESGEIS
jgi:hypothetical protein